MKKFRNKKFIIFILILFISIGFAYLSTTLNIAGLIGYKANSWNIYFDNVQMIINDVEGDRPTINNSKDTVNFNISFNEPSEVYRFSVDVVNSGTIDAMIGELIKTGIDSSNSDYIDYSISYSNGSNVEVNDLLSHGSKVRLVVNVEYKNSTERIAPTGTENYSLTVKYVQARDNARKVETILESGNNITFVLNNAKANTLSNIKIYGNSAQQHYTGRNLYNVDDYCTYKSNCVTNGSSADSDGWITLSYDNTEGSAVRYSNYFVNNLDLVIGNTYTVIMEVKSLTGTGSIYPNSTYETYGQLTSSHSYPFDSLQAGDVVSYTVTARECDGSGARSFGRFAPGQSGSITIRLSVIEGSSVTAENFVYEPYVGGMPSPNPDFPQDIQSVKDNINISIRNKNLLGPIHNSVYSNFSNGLSGLETFSSINGIYTISGTPVVDAPGSKCFDLLNIGVRTNYINYLSNANKKILKKGTYTFSVNVMDGSSTGSIIIGVYKTGIDQFHRPSLATVNLNKDERSKTFTLSNDTEVYFGMSYPTGECSFNNLIFTVQLEEGDHATEYAPYTEKVIPINLEEYELNKIADYKDYIYNRDGEWYIHKEIGNSTVTSLISNTTSNSNYNRWYKALPGADQIDKNLHNENGALCNIAFLINAGTTYNLLEGFTVTANKEIILYFDKWKEKTTQEINDWLAENNVYSYYKLLNYTDEKITDTTLINQLNSLLNNNIFEGTNYITVTGNDLTPMIEFDYERE